MNKSNKPKSSRKSSVTLKSPKSPRNNLGTKNSKQDSVPIAAILNIHGEHPIELTISARPEDWERLEEYITEDAEGFAWDFMESIVWGAIGQIEGERGIKVRGKNKMRQPFVASLKVKAGWLYAFFSYWSKKATNMRPEYLINLLKMAEDDGYTVQIGKKLDPRELTLYCIEKAYSNLCRLYELNINHPDNFYITYIQDDKRPTRIVTAYLRGRSPEQVDRLGRTNVILRGIFSDLKIY